MSYDDTKRMLNTLRKLNESKSSIRTIKEEIETENLPSSESTMDDVMVINDVEVKLLSTDRDDMGMKDEQKNAISQLIDNFKQQVSQIVEFDPGMTINESQIRLDGTLTDDDLSFVFIAGNDSGLYINTEMVKLEQETIQILDKLLKFNDTFKTAMEPLISQRSNN